MFSKGSSTRRHAPPHLIIAAWSRVLETSFESKDFVAWGQAFDMQTIVPNGLIGVLNNMSFTSACMCHLRFELCDSI